MDLKKAFDTVDHSILLKKLDKISVGPRPIRWFSDYLTDRMQSVKVGVCKSAKTRIRYGVPQGSILGPLLFIIYINDLEQYISDCMLKLYADDTALYTSASSQIE